MDLQKSLPERRTTEDFGCKSSQLLLLSAGFVNTLETNLYNTSLIPMTFTLRVPGDGSGENISKMSHYDSTIIDSPVTVPPKEFEIIPYSGVLDPKSSTPVKVAFCSNTVRKYDLSLVVDVAGVGPEVLSLPISARYSFCQFLGYFPSLSVSGKKGKIYIL